MRRDHPSNKHKGGKKRVRPFCTMCRKIAFPTQEDARAGADRIKKREGPKMRIYQCRMRHWHLTTQPKRDI